jgi:hypothetical protein
LGNAALKQFVSICCGSEQGAMATKVIVTVAVIFTNYDLNACQVNGCWLTLASWDMQHQKMCLIVVALHKNQRQVKPLSVWLLPIMLNHEDLT